MLKNGSFLADNTMKFRTCFVSNSSSSSFIIDASSVDEARQKLVDCLVQFLDERESHERHVKAAEEYVSNSLTGKRICLIKLDESLSAEKLQEATWGDWTEVGDDSRGKVLMADYRHGSVIAEAFSGMDDWDDDGRHMAKIMEAHGIERTT